MTALQQAQLVSLERVVARIKRVLKDRPRTRARLSRHDPEVERMLG